MFLNRSLVCRRATKNLLRLAPVLVFLKMHRKLPLLRAQSLTSRNGRTSSRPLRRSSSCPPAHDSGAWVTVPTRRPGTRHCAVRGRRVGGVRQWEGPGGNPWSRVGSHALGGAGEGRARYFGPQCGPRFWGLVREARHVCVRLKTYYCYDQL